MTGPDGGGVNGHTPTGYDSSPSADGGSGGGGDHAGDYNPQRAHTDEPSPTDVCHVCGLSRKRRSEPFLAEIVHSDGSVDWVCKPCDEAGRGLK